MSEEPWRARQSDIIRDIARRSRQPVEREEDCSYGAMALALLSMSWAEALLAEKPGNHGETIAAVRKCRETLAPHVPDYLDRP